jgi:hypothetical protein
MRAYDARQVIDETTSHLTKAASCQVIGYGYSQSTKRDETCAKWLVIRDSGAGPGGARAPHILRMLRALCSGLPHPKAARYDF